jgi:hypothetical protein
VTDSFRVPDRDAEHGHRAHDLRGEDKFEGQYQSLLREFKNLESLFG